jgi:ketosteroid isomerase-like protein
MKPINSCPHTTTRDYRGNVLGLSSWNPIKLSLIVAASLCLALVGCSPDNSSVKDVGSHLAIVDQWIEAVNSEDVAQFEQLHTETVVFNSYLQQNPYKGREDIWESFRRSYSGSIEKTYMFGQEESICLQVTAAIPKLSFLYVFDFEGDLISHVYEYSGAYDLTAVPLFEGVEITTDDSALSDRINTIDSQTKAVTDRDYAGFIETFNEDAILYVPPSKIPVTGKDAITNDVQSFTGRYPEVEVLKYRTFGQGNLVCQQAIVKNGPMNSLGFVNAFEDGKVSRVYEYFSNAELINN